VPDHLDRRVLPEPVIAFVRECQARVPCRLGGGAALAGAHLRHRLSRDLDLFFSERDALRALVPQLAETAAVGGGDVAVLRDAPSHVRAHLRCGQYDLELDLVHDAVAPLAPPSEPIDGIRLVSFEDLRAAKLTCLLSRAEPRDLVDVLFLDRAGHAPELDLPLALRKDAGMDPGVIAWLLRSFRTEPLPTMLLPLSPAELDQYRDALAQRFKAVARNGRP
jgi:hypothetical protein